MDILIKNMVCPRCLESVENIFKNLELPITEVELGKVHSKEELTKEQLTILKSRLKDKGFELLESRESKLIGQIKSLVIKSIYYQDAPLNVNFSTLLSQEIHQDYSYLSRLFSSVEGQTIEQFIIFQKIEKVKELLSYQELNTTEIANLMNYSSAAYLSTQFKRVTGMSPSEFKQQGYKNRKSIDKI